MVSFLSGNATPATVLTFSLSPITKSLQKNKSMEVACIAGCDC